MKLSKITSLICLAGLLFTVSCSDINNVTEADDLKKLTPAQLQLKQNLKELSLILKEIVTQPNVMQELEFAIRYNTDVRNKDERVTLGELLSDEAPYKKAWAKEKKSQALNAFSESFNAKIKALENSKYDSFEELLNFINKKKSKDFELYWPYSEYWHNNVKLPTITYDPIDNEHVNEGFRPVNTNGRSIASSSVSHVKWDTVQVDDNYAQASPTVIVMSSTTECDPELEQTPVMLRDCHDGGGGGSSSNIYNINVEEDQNSTYQVHLGYIKLTEQLDGLFRGGTDLRFILLDVVEIAPGQIEAKRVYLKKDLTRPDVTEERWKELNYLADHRWHSYQNTLPFHAYDHDGNGSTTIDVDYTIEDSNGNTVQITSSYEVADSRDDVANVFFDRQVYITNNASSGPNGLKNGFRVYKQNSLYWTLPHTIVNL